ncbi:AlpA family transcriptional regulator [Hydrogenophaga sp.]|uniref:helix-turn-helix transcriptional regulator n=1 Tax=Hydrogenophaga sp. TaxID=1904254 RepID=UPI002720855E|nr:helix-turn-helix domain-containing protein [Hydrogenophaga sp.]MDO9507633.1 helix-turn-helix domain-containing protein [Hydrogenophaga sp.]
MEKLKMEDITPDRLLRVAEVCQLLNCSRKHLREWVAQHNVPYIQHGNGHKKYLIADIRVMLTNIRSTAPTPKQVPRGAAARVAVPVFDRAAAQAAAAATPRRGKAK